MEKQQNRVWYLDYLRIIATIAVIVLHVAAQNWYAVGIDTFEWKVFCVSDSLVRWSVPVFVMISGALFLHNDKPLSIENLYKKYIWRLIIAFLFWSAVYISDEAFRGVGLKAVVGGFIKGSNHLWFIYMIIGLYMITPFLRKITESEKLTQYFLILTLIMTIFLPWVVSLLRIVGFPHASWIQDCYNAITSKMTFYFTSGYVGYYVLGYYLSRKDMSPVLRKVCYAVGIIGTIATVILTFWYSEKMGKPNSFFYSYLGFTTVCSSLGVFTFARYRLAKLVPGERMAVLISKASNYSFGVYLCHILVLNAIRSIFGISTLSGNPLVSVLGLSVTVLVVSYLISGIFNHIPGLKKYVV